MKRALIPIFFIAILAISLCVLNIPSAHADVGKFGYEQKGEMSGFLWANNMYAQNFTCLDDGQAITITTYIYQWGSYTPFVKYAIYSDSNNYPDALVGYTEEWQVTSGWNSWKALSIVSGGILDADIKYWLVIFVSDSCGFYFDYDVAGQRTVSRPLTYNGFPSTYPAGGSFSTYAFSIYCTYVTEEYEWAEVDTWTVDLEVSDWTLVDTWAVRPATPWVNVLLPILSFWIFIGGAMFAVVSLYSAIKRQSGKLFWLFIASAMASFVALIIFINL